MSIETSTQTRLKASDIIAEALWERGGPGGEPGLEQQERAIVASVADAIIARLAEAGLAIYTEEEIKEEQQMYFNPYPG